MQVLFNLEDYASAGTTENLIFTVVAVFGALWIYQLAAFILYSCLGGEIFGPLKYRTILARHTMDLTSMVIFCYMGFEGLEQLGGTYTSVHSLILAGGGIAKFGAERSFIFSSAAQRLCVWQIAYEAKNFCDSVIHNDGVIFLVHHTATGLLAVLSDFFVLCLFCTCVSEFIQLNSVISLLILSNFMQYRHFVCALSYISTARTSSVVQKFLLRSFVHWLASMRKEELLRSPNHSLC